MKVPYDPVELPLNAQTHGLVAPESYEIPAVSPLWTPVAYAAFDNSKLDEKVTSPGSSIVIMSSFPG